MQSGHVPHDERAPVVADEHGVVLAEVVEQRQEIAGQVADAVGADLRGR